ncbi:DUF202 domain-containing protein [Streptomyces sp. XM4193]|uniref:DUF202 domain-containing protein n=1 Tax=Streptomyces sp. XM4193 TaxID=2929782 RepID=UPI001FF806E1|nr:DUF202 domain-containing protein [Streptomyces sp. XM4193]MCK1799096.1 DUF202 domain-containing protein [Streptomyces sp. XM4193]
MSAVRDPGAQPERTRLAWRRTTLAATVVVLLAVRHQLVASRGVLGWTAVAVGCAAWLGLLTAAHLRMRRLLCAAPVAARPRHLALVCGCAVAAGTAGAGLLLLPGG